MKIYHIAAMSENNVIGKDGNLPWDLKEDLHRYKQITMGHPIIMGRKTFESLGKWGPLHGRRNIILTRGTTLKGEDDFQINKDDGLKEFQDCKNRKGKVALANNIAEAISYCTDRNEVFIVGGQGVYRNTLDLADELRLTIVHQEIEGGDSFYPELDEDEWVPSFVEPHGTHTYIDYVRKSVR